MGMPSAEHEGPLLLIENDPELPVRLMNALEMEVPEYLEVRSENIDFSQIVPTEYTADKVVSLWSARKKPVMGIVNEVQLGIDPRKKFTWPLYNASLRAKLECEVRLLVITLDEAVAMWAAEPIYGLQPECTFIPKVVGPSSVPWVRTFEEAIKDPELAVLSAMAHGNEETGLEVALCAVEAASVLDEERKALYADLVYRSLTKDTFQKLVQIMDMSKYEPQSEFCKTWYERGMGDGEAKGEKRGMEKGMEKGEEKGLKRSVLQLLSQRGIDLSAADQARIQSCSDLTLLEVWLSRILTATSAKDLFRDG